MSFTTLPYFFATPNFLIQHYNSPHGIMSESSLETHSATPDLLWNILKANIASVVLLPNMKLTSSLLLFSS